MRWLTGGADGLYGFRIAPLLGRFEFDLEGKTAYVYVAVMFLIVFVICKLVVNSPFGLTIRGIRENPIRMRLLGVPVLRRLVTTYASPDSWQALPVDCRPRSLSLSRSIFSSVLSGNALIMVILGGIGSLNGAILGAALFVLISDRAAAISPFHWLFALGIALILTVRYRTRRTDRLPAAPWFSLAQ